MAASTDLWGELEANQIRTPVAILREQAALLGAKTKNLVEASVYTQVENDIFYHSLNLVIPALDNYRYNLLSICHGPSIYPVTPFREFVDKGRFDTEQEFIEWLGAKLSSPETKRIVSNLLAQVAA